MGKEKYFMVCEERCHAHRQELIIAGSYDEAYMAYCSIVKPSMKSEVIISRITKKQAKHPDAPTPVKYKKGKFKEKERDFFITHGKKENTVSGVSFDDALSNLKKKVKIDKYEIEIRIAPKNLIKGPKRI